MIIGIDHLIIACEDPDAAAADLEARVGLIAAGGGRHEGMGTFNRIIWLADAYLELIGIDDREAALRHPLGAGVARVLDERGGGFVGYALLDGGKLEQTVHALHGIGSHIGPAIAGSRTRPDGETAEWWTAMPERVGPDGPPFLIQHAYSGAEWGPGALAERRAFVHPLGSPAILARLDIATDDPPSLAADYAAELGLEFWAVSDLAVCTVGRHVIRLQPRGRMPVPAVITLGAEVDVPAAVELLGVRFDVERVDLPLPAPNLA